MKGKIFLFTILTIFLIGIISAQGVSYCCERTTSGAWCQNAEQDQCDAGNCGTTTCNKAPTSCESTSYCRLGTCINSREGNCMPNTPQSLCSSAGGLWDARAKTDIPQCQLGCCLIGDQAAFTTQVRCKRLSSIYGLEVNYRPDIQNEIQCISSASPQAKGACIFEKEFERDCKVLTKKECQDLQLTATSAEFHEGYLCSAEELSTICERSSKTTCVEGKDAVYFLDTCGNIANVYDQAMLADNAESKDYWTKIQEPKCTVGDLQSLITTCGNCDYLGGTTCKQSATGGAVCKDLKCDYKGQEYKHGETWCDKSRDDENSNNPGAKYFRLVCYNSEVSVEPCVEYRQEICVQSSIPTSQGDFKTAACKPNKWQDCYAQTDEKECLNSDRRDCQWIDGKAIFKSPSAGESEAIPTILPSGLQAPKQEEDGTCAPKYAPGFDYWKNESDAGSICSLANDICQVEYMTPIGSAAFSLFGGQPPAYILAGDSECLKKCKEKCLVDDPTHLICDEPCANACRKTSCLKEKSIPGGTVEDLKPEWREPREAVCKALGDCGVKNNYNGKEGYFDDWEDSYTREEVNKTEAEGGAGGGLGGIFGGLLGG
ncbi:hypothetical protein M0R19_06715 [Candidatus Pacearchaeota archaeon]|nr:hypothetical protein [Candidatus Pacearchaeota archaeon]